MEIKEIAERLKNGETLLYPTDTSWGLGCDAMSVVAIEKLYQIKNRSREKSMIILVDSEQRLQSIVDVPEMAWEIIDLSEKPVTIVYQNPRNLPKELLAEDGSIGIRIVKNDFCKQLIRRLNAPLVSTSANISGQESSVHLKDISSEIKDAVDIVVDEQYATPNVYSASSVIKIWPDGQIKVLRE